MQIEKNIPMPARGQHSDMRVLAEKMEIGDSVKVKKEKAVSMCQAIRRAGGLASMRKIDEKIWRVWRVQ